MESGWTIGEAVPESLPLIETRIEDTQKET